MAKFVPKPPQPLQGFVAYSRHGWPATWTAAQSARAARDELVRSLSTKRLPVTWADLLKLGWRVRKMIISPVPK